MNLRNEWHDNIENDVLNRFYSREETVENVTENFEIRRWHSAEGYDIDINGVTERCLVQTSSNPLRELNDYRKIQCPLSADVRRGYYVQYEGFTWIIDTNVVDVDGAYWSTRMSRCQYILRWQNSSGEIMERWAYASDQTKYSNGETGNSTIVVADNQYGLLLPIDKETKQLHRGMRFAFDFDDAETPDIYELTNRKVNLAEGTIQLSFTFHAFDKDRDKKVMMDNGNEVWICDYITPDSEPTTPSNPDEMTDLSASIKGVFNIKNGYTRSYSATFTDGNGDTLDNVEYRWNIVSDFPVEQSNNGEKLILGVDDDSLIGESFLLQVLVDDAVVAEVGITVTEGF